VTNPESGRVLLVEEVGLGGITDYTNELARALTRVGWDVRLATGCDHDPTTTPEVTVHRVFPYIRRRHWLGRLVHRLHLARSVNGITHVAGYFVVAGLAQRCDVVHVQGEEWPPLGAVLLLLLRLTGRSIVYTPHNTFDRGAHSYPRAHRLIRHWAARIVIHSEYDRQALSAAQARKAVVIPHGEYGALAGRGKPSADAEADRAALGLSGEEPVVLLFGQLRRDKGVGDLLEAAAEVNGVRVVIAGEDSGALDEVAELLADTRLSGRVLVLEGFVPTERLGRLFAAADVVALPYPKASASGVLLLAYGYERPVLCYPVGGLPEYVLDGQTGWLCKRADVGALAETLRAVCAAGRVQCRARGMTARRFSEERFGWNTIARMTVELYVQLCNPANPTDSR